VSSAGIYGQVIERGQPVGPCLIIGAEVPRLHHSDGIPVYLVTEHWRGTLVRGSDGKARELLAYPSAWPGPGDQTEDRWIYAHHERLPWDAPVPLFDRSPVPA
jgi:hypothetical protein